MSTILDALRKVERERESSTDQMLETPPIVPEARRRRSFPLVAVAMCALLGFAGGAILSWLLPGDREVEVAALSLPPPPPAIPVPRAPLRAKPVAVPAVEANHDTTGALASPLAPPLSESGDPPAQVVAAEKLAPPVPGEDLRAGATDGKPAENLAALDKQASALEPSPFNPPRELQRDAALPNTPPNPAPGSVARGDAAAPAGEVADTDLAALAPAPSAVPDAPSNEAVLESEPEPEPETPAETLVDTGRSPPGAPKVALSFLQWSPDPARRFAFISIDGAPSQRVHEGEVAAGLTVAAITKTGVQFKREGTSFMIRPRH